MNCLVNRLAIAEDLEYVLLAPLRFLKEMGWFGGILILLPVRVLILSQNLLTFVLKEREEMSVRHRVRATSLVKAAISMLRVGMVGSPGFMARRLSRSSIRSWISGLRVGSKSFRKPEGMVDIAVFCRILLKIPTAVYMEAGGARLRNLFSEMEVKEVQSARLKFV